MNSLHYRQDIIASIQIAGHQEADVDSHGGNRAKGSHITATFGQQLMVAMYDLDSALTYAKAWTDPEHQWVFAHLPAAVAGSTTRDARSTGPSVMVRATAVRDGRVRYDSNSRTAVVHVASLTWIVRDKAAANSMLTAWDYIGQIAPAILGTRHQLTRTP